MIPPVNIRLDALSEEECVEVAAWRNGVRGALRTATLSTPESQREFYRNVVCNPLSRHRYWAVRQHDFLGMAGLTDISPENGSAEISLIVAPRYRHSGTRYGSRTVEAILVEAFMRMRLETVYGEVYTCNTDAVVFWKTIAERLSAYTTTLPRRKFWNGKLWDSLYFSIAGDTWLPSE